MQKVFIFGHRVPDTDSVCASISLSYLKNKMGMQTEPRVLGSLNKESKFVLDYFKVPEPEFLNDVKVQVRSMHYDTNAMIHEDASIYDTYRMLVDTGVTGLPLINDKKILTGYVNIKEISKYLIDGDENVLHTTYDNIVRTLKAKEILRFDEQIEGNILAASYKSETFLNSIALDKNDVLIVGDRYKIQKYAVQSGIKLLILVNNNELPEELLEIAKKNKVNVLSVPFNTFRCATTIKLCNYVHLININPNPIKFTNYDYRDDFVEISGKLGHTNYPVVNQKEECIGMLRLVDTNSYDKVKVILVDHNQESQSADGIHEADILEVIDHHNLGTIGTATPINFRSMPVGCTCTLIYKLYQEAGVEIPSDMAGLMLSAILSDTLLFKSPTTTELDIEVGKKLAELANVDYQEYGMKMFKAASSVAGMSVEDIINSDIKSFKCGDTTFKIGQVMTMDFEEIQKKEKDIVSVLNTMCEMGDLKVSLLFVTDIIKNGSYMFYSEGADELIKEAYGIGELKQGVYLDGYVSRKKQMLPPILDILEKRS